MEIANLIIDIFSLIATVAVSFLIYWFQHRHELELERAEQKKQDEILEQEAHEFLIKNEEDRDYLPWCIIASNLHRHEKHARKIYTNFCACSDKLQKKILELAEFTLIPIGGTSWVDDSFKLLEECIDKFRLGQQKFLYDGAKYFHRAFDNYRKLDFNENKSDGFQPIYKLSSLVALFDEHIDGIRLDNYIEQYFDYILYRNHENVENDNPIPPVDYVWSSKGLGYANEEVVCYWVMLLVHNFVVNIHNRFFDCYFESEIRNNSTGAYAETYEDYYYSTLYWIYFTFKKAIGDATKDESKKVRTKKAKKKKAKAPKVKKDTKKSKKGLQILKI